MALGSEMDSKVQKKTLKKQCTTRWESKHAAVACIKERYADVLKALTAITLTSLKREEQHEAETLKKKLESYEFILILVTWERILRSLYPTSKYLQKTNLDLQQAQNKLKTSFNLLQETREKYDEIVAYAKSLCKKWGISEIFPDRRKRYAKKYFDELASDNRLDVSEDRFRVSVFLPVFDCVISQLDSRFQGMTEIVESFSFLYPSDILNISEEELKRRARNFANKYSSDVNSDIVRQIMTFQTLCKKRSN